MKKILSFISKANQVLLFGVLLFAIGAFLFEKHSSPEYSVPEPSIPLINSNEDLESIPEINRNYQIEYSDKIGDNHVFQLKLKFLKSHDLESRSGYASLMKLDLSKTRDQIVNVLFVQKNNTVTKVFDHDVFITDIEIPRIWNPKETEIDKLRCVFAVISNDTNGDGFLTPDDQVDIYSTNSNGTDLKQIVENIEEHYLISHGQNSQILVTQLEGTLKTFWLYSLSDASIQKIELDNDPNKLFEPTGTSPAAQ